jgi:hypothetical protein
MRLILRSLFLLVMSQLCWALDLYQGEAQVSGPDEASRAQGIVVALEQVLEKVSANTQVASNPTVSAALGNAGRLMQRYEYRQELSRDTSGKPIATTFLRVSFYPQSVDALLLRAGFPVWGRERPRVMIALELDGRLLDRSELAELVERAEARGISLRFPGALALSAEELEQLRAGSVRELHSTLGGGLVFGGSLGQGRASLDDGRRVEQVNLPSSQGEIADRLIATLARQQLANSNTEPSEFEATVGNVAGAADYARVLAMLGKLSSVRQVRVLSADSQGLKLKLLVVGGAERLQQTLINMGNVDMPSTDPAYLILR